MSGYLWRATARNVNQALKEVNAFEREGDYRPATREALRRILEDQVEKEIEEYLGRERYERCEGGRWGDYRNGQRIRHLLTEIGEIVIGIRRTRKKYILRVLEAYRRRMRTVDQLIMACFVLGMSTRKVSTALMSLLGMRISASTVSEVAKG